MAGWAVSEDNAESAVLLLSELVSNAVLPARNTGRVLVSARLRWGLLECEVASQDLSWGPGPPNTMQQRAAHQPVLSRSVVRPHPCRAA